MRRGQQKKIANTPAAGMDGEVIPKQEIILYSIISMLTFISMHKVLVA
jgi:hypothetical protein